MFIEVTGTYMTTKLIVNTDHIEVINKTKTGSQIGFRPHGEEENYLNIIESYEMIKSLLQVAKIELKDK